MPCAFVQLRPEFEGAGAAGSPTAAELIAYCRENMAGFKCPKQVVFRDLPTTSTGMSPGTQIQDTNPYNTPGLVC